jgi:RimJ/RimL family protein N-acetyltransferase
VTNQIGDGLESVNRNFQDAADLRKERALNPEIYQFDIVATGETPDETRSCDKYAGGVMLNHVDDFHRNCEAGIIISPQYHRQGVATDALHRLLSFAFDQLNMHRVYFITGEDNAGMRSWLEHLLKATYEGLKRDKWREPDGGFCNAVEYSILEDEWRTVGKKSLEYKMDSRG